MKKTAEIAKLSEESTEDLKKTTVVSRKAVELSQSVLSEMKSTRLLLTAPLVTAYFERRTVDKNSYLFFTVENIGNGVAKNIQYNFSPELEGKDTESIKRIVKLGRNVDSLPPNYQLLNLFGRAGSYIDLESEDNEELNTDLPRRFEVTVTFQDAVTDESYSKKYSLDLRVPLGTCAQ